MSGKAGMEGATVQEIAEAARELVAVDIALSAASIRALHWGLDRATFLVQASGAFDRVAANVEKTTQGLIAKVEEARRG